MPIRPVNKNIELLLFSIFIIFILTFSLINLKNILSTQEVLGIETIENQEDSFWSEFLNNNPNYVPGWIEIGQFEKASKIDPNYQDRIL
jgi:hypothetical protein